MPDERTDGSNTRGVEEPQDDPADPPDEEPPDEGAVTGDEGGEGAGDGREVDRSSTDAASDDGGSGDDRDDGADSEGDAETESDADSDTEGDAGPDAESDAERASESDVADDGTDRSAAGDDGDEADADVEAIDAEASATHGEGDDEPDIQGDGLSVGDRTSTRRSGAPPSTESDSTGDEDTGDADSADDSGGDEDDDDPGSDGKDDDPPGNDSDEVDESDGDGGEAGDAEEDSDGDAKEDSDDEAEEDSDDEAEEDSDGDAEGDSDDAEEDGDDDADETEDEDVADAEPTKASADGGTGTASEPTYPREDRNVGGISTPPDDEEMPLADHIEEMISRLAIVLLFGAAGTAIGILWASDAIAMMWGDVIPEPEEWPPHIYHPLELWLTRIKVAALLGIMVALPMFVYQCYLFMRPGLYPNERKYYLAAVPSSVILAGLGMLFSYLLVLPVLFRYFTFYSEGSAEIHYALGETFNLVITLTAFLAIVFQIPLLIMLAIMMGVTSRRWLAEKRLYFWAAFAGLAFMFTFDPTMMAPVIVAIVMILLFEGTLALLKWTGVD